MQSFIIIRLFIGGVTATHRQANISNLLLLLILLLLLYSVTIMLEKSLARLLCTISYSLCVPIAYSLCVPIAYSLCVPIAYSLCVPIAYVYL